MASAQLGWIDVHGHFRLPESHEQAQQRLYLMRQGQFLLAKPDIWDAQAVIDYLDRAGVSMQMLSNIPKTLSALKTSNDFGASLVQQFPSRFGLLAALPTDNPDECLSEINRALKSFKIPADGFAVTTVYNGVGLSDPSLDAVWAELNERCATVFVHPDAYASPSQGRPAPLLEVAFDTTRTIIDMLYTGVFRRFPDIRFVIAHAGACVPVLSGRLELLGAEEWVPNPQGIAKEEIEGQLGKLYLDTAASAKSALDPAIRMVGIERCVYGSDCGVPCSTELTMEENRQSVCEVERRMMGKSGQIGINGWRIFREAANRAAQYHIGHC